MTYKQKHHEYSRSNQNICRQITFTDPTKTEYTQYYSI